MIQQRRKKKMRFEYMILNIVLTRTERSMYYDRTI